MTLPITEIDVESAIASRTPNGPDRRRSQRRGSAIQVIRFNGERRMHPDRRQRARRGFARLPVTVAVTLRHAGLTLAFRSSDLSVLGTGLQDGPLLPVGALARLTFTLPDDLEEFPITTWAQVVGRRNHVLHVRFVGLRACDARRMGRFLAHRERRGAQPRAEAPYRF